MSAFLLKAVVVLSGAVLMSLEILGSRVLAPTHGSSVYVWGSLITTFLAGLALGYALGGRLADRRPSLSLLSVILSGAAVLILPAVVWAPGLLVRLAAAGWDVRWSSLAAASLFFLPPSVAMGMVSPFAVRIAIRRVESAGSVAGAYSALSTGGSILGTLLTAFLLIPSFAVKDLLLVLGGTLALCALLLIRERASAWIAGAATLACGVAAAVQGPSPSIGGERLLLQRDTPYHHIAVTQLDRTRHLRFDNLPQSAVNLDHPERSVYVYDQAFFLAFALRPAIQRVCMIGLGGAMFPRALARLRPEAVIESVEIDPAVPQIARDYFLYEESQNVRTVIEDGRVFLSRPGAPYDLIVLDAFNSTGVPFHLTTREFFEAVVRRLTPDGVFAANYIGRMMGREGRLFWASYQTIRRRFGQVYLVSGELASGKKDPWGNVILLATVSADPVDSERIREAASALSARWKLPLLPGFAGSLLHSPEPPAGTLELT
ncbi:MAG: fused MFS/spermidine synthase, partial [Thermoanaerobaculia bacterium]